MESKNTTTTIYEDVKINVKFKLSALWVAVMLCYIYGDIIGFFVPGTIDEILTGNMGFLGPVTQGLVLASGVMMSIPAIMVFLSLVLRPKINRLTNIIFGIIFTGIIIVTMFMDPWYYYIYLGIIEMALTLLVVWYASKWPKA